MHRGTPLVALALALGARAAHGQARFEVHEASIAQIQAALAAGRVTSAELVDAYLARIDAYDRQGPALNAILRLNPKAREDAAALDAERAGGRVRGPLHGIPILLKDNYDTTDLPTTGSSLALATHVPPDDATTVRRLRAAGAIILGKTNLHELAAGIRTVSSLGGQTRNPYDPERYPGGSSGGTSAAIAASFAAIGYGSDTCGSIRIPSAYNSLFGLRPTKGLISTDGIIPLSHTQDVPGPLARTVEDLVIGLDAVAGPDPADPTTQTAPTIRFADALRADALQGARIGILLPLFGLDPEEQEVTALVRAALERMRTLGADVVEIDAADLDDRISGTAVIDYEFRFDLADYLAASTGAPIDSLGDVLRLGLYHTALEESFRRRNAVQSGTSEYQRALERRAALRTWLLELFARERLDALAYPTMQRPPARIGRPQGGTTCQLSASTSLPAMAMPAGFTADGVPVGLELLGREFEDAKLVGYAYAWERAVSPRRSPPTTPPLRALPPAASIIMPAAASAPGLQAAMRFDATTGNLSWDVRVAGVALERIIAIVLTRDAVDGGSAVVHRLSGLRSAAARGSVALSDDEREDLENGRLHVALFVQDQLVPLVKIPVSAR